MKTDAESAEIMNSNPGGDAAPVTVLDCIAGGGLFDGLERQAGLDDDKQVAEALGRNRRGLAEAMSNLGFSAPAARQLMALVRSYHFDPRDGAEAETDRLITEDALRLLWQEDFGGRLAAARNILATLESVAPAFFRNGIGNSVEALKLLAGIAAHRARGGR